VEKYSAYRDGKMENLKGPTELTLEVLAYFLRHGTLSSCWDLCVKTGASKKKIECILSVLVKRGYLRKIKKSRKYVLAKEKQ
jgi:DNA-binding IclR family transcriptional regulator